MVGEVSRPAVRAKRAQQRSRPPGGTEHQAGDDVGDRWTLRAADRALLGNKSGTTRLGFAVLLKLFQLDGRFPRRPEDVPLAAVEALAAQVGVPAAAWRGYAWQGRTIEYQRREGQLSHRQRQERTRQEHRVSSKRGQPFWDAWTLRDVFCGRKSSLLSGISGSALL